MRPKPQPETKPSTGSRCLVGRPQRTASGIGQHPSDRDVGTLLGKVILPSHQLEWSQWRSLWEAAGTRPVPNHESRVRPQSRACGASRRVSRSHCRPSPEPASESSCQRIVDRLPSLRTIGWVLRDVSTATKTFAEFLQQSASGNQCPNAQRRGLRNRTRVGRRGAERNTNSGIAVSIIGIS